MFFWVRNKKHLNLKKKGGALLSLIFRPKRISVRFPGRFYGASMTVEACFVLPFFLFAFLNIISVIELYRLQGNMSAAMHETAKQMAVYGYEYKEVRNESAGTAESLGLTYVYAAARVQKKLGNAYFASAPIAGGASSVSWLKSSVMKADDCIDLVAEYRVTPPAAVVGWHDRLMYNRMRTRAWTGYDNAGKTAKDRLEEIVYMTPEGTVYHCSRGCAYLKLSISAVDKSFLIRQRNKDGEKYYPCEQCAGSSGNTVYITDYGNRYHASLSCSKLKRTILAVPISQTGGRGACSKCGN